MAEAQHKREGDTTDDLFGGAAVPSEGGQRR